jgi:hypothetical protein
MQKKEKERTPGLRPTLAGLSTRCACGICASAAGVFLAITRIRTRMRGIWHCAGGNSRVITPPPSFYSAAGPTHLALCFKVTNFTSKSRLLRLKKIELLLLKSYIGVTIDNLLCQPFLQCIRHMMTLQKQELRKKEEKRTRKR